jgi:hypothetical protein
MFHPFSQKEPLNDGNPGAGKAQGRHPWLLPYGLIAALAFGPFSIGAGAQSHAPVTFHSEGTFAEATSNRITSTTATFAFIYVSRDVRKGNGSGPVVTTNVSYTVCVLTFTKNRQVCQNGYGTIANSELSGDVNYGLGTPPKGLTLNFDSATEPGYLLYASECDGSGQNCSDVTPSGGPVSVNWKKNGLSSTTTTGTTRETLLNKLTFMSVGQSRTFSADSWGTMAGAPFTGGYYPTVLGSAHNLTFNVASGTR